MEARIESRGGLHPVQVSNDSAACSMSIPKPVVAVNPGERAARTSFVSLGL